MKDKILALLQAKFAGVRKDGLAQLAGSLSLSVTTEDEAKALVEKLTAEQVGNYVKEFRSAVDGEVSTSTKTFEDGLKAKFDFVEKGKTDPNQTPPAKDEPQDLAAIVKAAVEAATNPLKEELSSMRQKTAGDERLVRLNKILETCEDTFLKSKIQKDFTRMAFQAEEDFAGYLTDTENDVKVANQTIADASLAAVGSPLLGGKSNDKEVSAEVKEFIDKRKSD